MASRDTAKDAAAEGILARLSDPKNYPEESIAPYEEFSIGVSIGANIYYFTSGGILYRKVPGVEDARGFSCGYLTDDY